MEKSCLELELGFPRTELELGFRAGTRLPDELGSELGFLTEPS
jgi:hypothetical protein